MTHTATLRLACRPDSVSALVGALHVETDDAPPGAVVSISGEDDAVRLDVTAPTLSALRAALQGSVRLFEAARGAIEPAKG